MSSPSPVTDGKNVWVMTGTGVLKAFDFDGNEIWSRDIQKDYGRFGLNWGYASSPLLHEDSLYVQVMHGMKTRDPSYMLRIDKKTGQDAVARRAATPASLRIAGFLFDADHRQDAGDDAQLVVLGGDVVTGHDLKTGEELWRMTGFNPTNDAAYRTIASARITTGSFLRPRASGRCRRSKSAAQRRYHEIESAVAVQQRTRRADAGGRREILLFGQRSRDRLVPGRQDRQADLRRPAT